MQDQQQTPERIAELLVHIGRAARSEDRRSSLTAAQWTCLRFFARANGSTRTPSGFARFQATTRGTASQIIKTLETRGLIARHRCEQDRRSVRIDLTVLGRAALLEDPLRDLVGVIGQLREAERERFVETLSRMASALAALREVPAFGTCTDCSHFTQAPASPYCACMAADLSPEDIDRLCVRFRSTAPDLPTQGDPDVRT